VTVPRGRWDAASLLWDLRIQDDGGAIVAYTLRRSGNAEAIRIISARRASRRERAAYTANN
jgi:uncharacterized DUF497 family protein